MPDKHMRIEMDLKERVRTLVQEAELYRSQGLYAEAREIYHDAEELIKKVGQIKNRANLLGAISKKIGDLEDYVNKMQKAPTSAEMSPKVQDLVKKLFSFSREQDEDAAALEGAITLAKFGQFDRALMEFNELIKKDSLRVVASKNILRCYIARASADDAVTQYHQWVSSELFSTEQLGNIRVFLEDMLEKKGIDQKLPQLSNSSFEDETGLQDDELLDISSIGITLDSGPHKGKLIELEVSFQTGNMISLIISTKDKDLIENLKVGFRLNNVQFYSPIAIFQGAGIVSAKTKINSGPKRGDYSLDIKIVST